MAWIESHQALGRHPKLLQLAALLKIDAPKAVGHLHFLWWWGLDFAPTGVIANPTPVLIAQAAEWKGNAERFWLALVQAGWIDVNEECVSIHDWPDYAGRLMAKRAANAERMRAARATNGAAHTTRTSGARAGATVPTVPTGDSLRSSPLPDQPAAAAAALPVSGSPGPVRAQEALPPDVQADLDRMEAEAYRSPEQIAAAIAALGRPSNGSSSSSSKN